ncbi:MAG: phytanoyl-CoA dioxygenase family protein [Planctomycetes bacterium]|nr:phytanoyl-CoA dioxygenase family protein [Planctomycetota bacterium]
MIAVRVHLDDCGANNGRLQVLPGSHRFGWLDDELDDWKRRVPEVVCTVRSGGVVTMCPLILHASAASDAVCHRRVIHIEFAASDSPAGLEWNNRIGSTTSPTQSADEQPHALERASDFRLDR